jgi:hypothetical protein
LTASFGTALAVNVVVLGAFVGAAVTELTAETTDLFQEMGVASHEIYRQAAHVRTVPIPADALDERSSIRFDHARFRTVIAFLSTAEACVDTRLQLMLHHKRAPSNQ